MSTPVVLLIAVGVAALLAFLVTRGGDENSPTESTPDAPEPAAEAPVAEEPAAEEPAAEEPAAEEPAAEEPAAEEPAAEEPAAEEPAAEEPAAEEPVAEEPAAEEPAVEEPVEEEPAAEEPVAEEPAAEEPVAEEPAAASTGAGGSNVLALLEVSGDQLGGAARSTLTAAVQLSKASGVELHVCCIGSDTASAAQAAVDGVHAVHTITDSAFDKPVAELYVAAALTAAEAAKAGVVVAPASSVAKDYLPRVAEAIGAGMITEALSVEGPKRFTRALWAGSAIATVEAHSERLALTIQPTAFEPVAPGDGSPSALDFQAPSTKARFVEFSGTVSERPSLGDADVVVSGGRGCGVADAESGFDFGPVEKLADSLGGAVGASRAVVDAGWVPNDWQVGQTGKTVAPKLYIACGISGAIQHVAGMKGSKTIVAINKDPEAPIFQVADYGLVADLHKACPELIEKISGAGLKVG